MKPVELEILMKDGLTPGLKNAGRVVRQYSGESQAALKEVQNSLKLQQEYVGKLEKELKGLEKSLKGVVAGSSEWTQIKKRIAEVTKEIENESPAIDELKAKYEELKGNAESADVSLRTQLKNLTQEIAALMVAYAKLSEGEKNTAEGEALLQHIEQLTEEAGVLRDAMGDTAAAINNAASDTRGLDQLSGALQLAIDGFGLATAGAGIFGASQEELIEIQTKLQSAIVASNALSSIQNNLQKQSALMQGIQIIQTKAATAAENIKTAAQGRGVIVTKGATIAQAAFNAVAKANPYILLATACLTVVGALWAFSKGSKAAKEAEEERQRQLEETKELQKQMAQEIGDSAGSQISSYMKLRREWNALGDDLKKKKQFIDENKKAFTELGFAVNDVATAENFLIGKTDDVIEAFVLRAKAAAYEKSITEAYQKMVQEQIEADFTAKNTLTPNVKKGQSLTATELSRAGGKGAQKQTYMDYTSIPGGAPIGRQRTVIEVTDPEAFRKGYEEETERIRLQTRADAESRADAVVAEMNEGLVSLQSKLTSTYNKIGIPESTTEQPTNPEKDTRLEYERKVADELQKLRWKNQQEEIDLMSEGSEKRRRQISLNYEKEIADIRAQESKWKEAQNGSLTEEQSGLLTDAYVNAGKKMKQNLDEISADEIAKNREKLDKLLEQYRDYDQRRRDIDTEYEADMRILEKTLVRMTELGQDTTQIEGTIEARTKTYQESIRSLQGEILESSDFYEKLFGNVADRGYKVLKEFFEQAKDVINAAKTGADGVEITIPVKDAEGKFVKQTVRITVEEYQNMVKRLQEMRKQLEKDNPFAALKTSWSNFIKVTKDKDGDVDGALKELLKNGHEVTATIRGWSDALGDVFGGNFKKSMGEIMDFCDGLMDMGGGIAQIWSGDIVGGITNVLGGLGSIFSLFSSWKEKMEEMRREWYIAEIETNRALRERSAIYAANRSQISDIITDVELLNWLIRRGYAKPSSTSVWESESASLNEYIKNLREETSVYDELWNRLQNSEGHYEWGNSLNGGSATWSLKGFNAEMIELWYNQDKLSDEAKAYYEAWKESGKTIEELIQNIEECKNSMREMVMGVSFDSFLSNAKEALKEMRGDVSKLGEFTEDTLANAILNGFMYKDLASVLEPLYNELSDAFIEGTADKSYLEDWRSRFEDIMTAAGDRLGEIADAAGIDMGPVSGTSQTGKAGGFTAMSQDQGTKLEGLFVSVQMHTASIDEQMEDVGEKMNQASEHLRKIEDNTRRAADKLDEVADNIEKIIRDGLKTK